MFCSDEPQAVLPENAAEDEDGDDEDKNDDRKMKMIMRTTKKNM